MNFIPRLSEHSPSEMRGNYWWYSSGNIFYPTFGLPNCTCYAYGRYAEVRGGFAPLPRGNAGTWWNTVSSDFQKGQTPKLGAVACWYDANGRFAGHVAIVEEIRENGDIVTSNSAYGSSTYYFYLQTFTAGSNYKCNYHASQGGNYQFQGFIYNDDVAPVTNIAVAASIAGCFAIESTMNPGIWESLIPSDFDHQYQYDNIGGFGLGQWTNVGTSHGRLWNLYQYSLNENVSVYDGETQLRFMLVENYWANSSYTRGSYTTLDEFLATTDTNIDDLVWDFLANWEGVPGNRYQDRLDKANEYYQYISEHMNDNPDNYQWISSNAYLGTASQHINVMCLYFWLSGQAPSPPPPPILKKSGLPVWMMCKYKRRF